MHIDIENISFHLFHSLLTSGLAPKKAINTDWISHMSTRCYENDIELKEVRYRDSAR